MMIDMVSKVPGESQQAYLGGWLQKSANIVNVFHQLISVSVSVYKVKHCSGFAKLTGSGSDWLVLEDHVFVFKMLWNQLLLR